MLRSVPVCCLCLFTSQPARRMPSAVELRLSDKARPLPVCTHGTDCSRARRRMTACYVAVSGNGRTVHSSTVPSRCVQRALRCSGRAVQCAASAADSACATRAGLPSSLPPISTQHRRSPHAHSDRSRRQTHCQRGRNDDVYTAKHTAAHSADTQGATPKRTTSHRPHTTGRPPLRPAMHSTAHMHYSTLLSIDERLVCLT